MGLLFGIFMWVFTCKAIFGGDGKRKKSSSWYDSLSEGDKAYLYEHHKHH